MRVKINNEKENRLVIENPTREGSRTARNGETKLFVARIENYQIAHR